MYSVHRLFLDPDSQNDGKMQATPVAISFCLHVFYVSLVKIGGTERYMYPCIWHKGVEELSFFSTQLACTYTSQASRHIHRYGRTSPRVRETRGSEPKQGVRPGKRGLRPLLDTDARLVGLGCIQSYCDIRACTSMESLTCGILYQDMV